MGEWPVTGLSKTVAVLVPLGHYLPDKPVHGFVFARLLIVIGVAAYYTFRHVLAIGI